MKRVVIGSRFMRQPLWKVLLGVPLIYLPLLLTIPFVLLGVMLARAHLKFVGGINIRPFGDFLPAWVSHRYRYGEQIVYRTHTRRHNLRAQRWFWIFNCKLYCPMSVALFRYSAYLVMVIENWWCPFGHDQKGAYAPGAIDRSYWHLFPDERERLAREDRDNPIWNEAAQKGHD